MVISFGFMHIIYGCSVSLLDTLIRRVFTFLLAASVFRGKIVLRRVYQQQRFQTLRCHQFFVHDYIYMYIQNAVINSLYMFTSTCTYKTFWSLKQYCHTIKISQGITTNIFHENMQFFRPKLIHYLFWTINRKRYQENNPIEFLYVVFRKPKQW